MTEQFTEEERKSLTPFFTNLDEPISAFSNSGMGVAGVRIMSCFGGRIRTQLLSRVTVLSLTEKAAMTAADLLALLGRRGEPIALPDALIAATALEAFPYAPSHFRRARVGQGVAG